MNWQAATGTSAAVPPIAEPETANRTLTAVGDPEGDWLCAWCHHRVANERDRFQYDGKDEFSFSNPDGICFEIITFSQAPGCHQTGVPTLEHTWFPGEAWSYCHCDNCSQHLGWFYTSPLEFVGLIKSRIVRALCVRN